MVRLYSFLAHFEEKNQHQISFQNYPIFPAIYYPLQQHLHCAQPIIQILLTVNRMSCVLHPWKYSQATMTLFMLILRAITIVITAICTFITVLRLTRMSKRLVSSERTLCIASFSISACFLGTAGAESIFAFQVVRTSTNISYFLLPISWDILNVGTPIVMVLASSQLRKHVFGNLKRSRSNSKVDDVTIVTGI
ncbi:hypothetical protein B9Z55_009144 [Caenorhabditis nigoni]|uniref:Serpentine receptor class gamma n=1 Tax=Caenorhabditis nigoni TaxID=1611254 RepID=A0A2G5URJ3_9PELO|nr:hypothetical protein B9Z55_009144 [Caenorhabditis nigoni]